MSVTGDAKQSVSRPASILFNSLGALAPRDGTVLPLSVASALIGVMANAERLALALLSPVEMARADALAVASGVPSLSLMEAAGRVVADEICCRFSPRPTAVLCGPGNNGGDGYVVARVLKDRGWPVWAESLLPIAALKGDAANVAGRWAGETLAVSPDNPMAELFIDALFGAGLTRPLEGEAARLASALSRAPEKVVAIDIPSGVDGATGLATGPAFKAALTVTFFRPKPGHFLMPGRAHCGKLIVRDIGIPPSVLEEIAPATFENGPALWSEALPRLGPAAHKYMRGHAVVVSGPPWTLGAARLAAEAALRIGAGLVTIGAPAEALPAHAAHLTAIMLRRCDGPVDLSAWLADERIKAVVLGPGGGVGETLRAMVEAAASSGAGLVLDADALTSFAADPVRLFACARKWMVLTPHEGEFERLFPGLLAAGGGRLGAARAAAARAGMIVVLKGADTIVAAPDGRAAINTRAPPSLATAGSGDVLAGAIAGLMAQGLPAFEAAAAGVIAHGAAALELPAGFTAEELPRRLAAALIA